MTVVFILVLLALGALWLFIQPRDDAKVPSKSEASPRAATPRRNTTTPSTTPAKETKTKAHPAAAKTPEVPGGMRERGMRQAPRRVAGPKNPRTKGSTKGSMKTQKAGGDAIPVTPPKPSRSKSRSATPNSSGSQDTDPDGSPMSRKSSATSDSTASTPLSSPQSLFDCIDFPSSPLPALLEQEDHPGTFSPCTASLPPSPGPRADASLEELVQDPRDICEKIRLASVNLRLFTREDSEPLRIEDESLEDEIAEDHTRAPTSRGSFKLEYASLVTYLLEGLCLDVADRTIEERGSLSRQKVFEMLETELCSKKTVVQLVLLLSQAFHLRFVDTCPSGCAPAQPEAKNGKPIVPICSCMTTFSSATDGDPCKHFMKRFIQVCKKHLMDRANCYRKISLRRAVASDSNLREQLWMKEIGSKLKVESIVSGCEILNGIDIRYFGYLMGESDVILHKTKVAATRLPARADDLPSGASILAW